MTETRLQIDPSTDEADLAAWAPSVGATGWVIVQSYPKLLLQAWSAPDPLPTLPHAFAGRVFGTDAEIRWTRDRGQFRLWRYWENPSAEELVDVEERRYYCWGEWRNNRFWEPKLLEPLHYPGPLNRTLQDSDRPFFTVREFYRKAPSSWPTGIDEIEALLNRPHLAAYRLTGLDFAQD